MYEKLKTPHMQYMQNTSISIICKRIETRKQKYFPYLQKVRVPLIPKLAFTRAAFLPIRSEHTISSEET